MWKKELRVDNSPLLLKEGWHDEGVTGWLIRSNLFLLLFRKALLYFIYNKFRILKNKFVFKS